MTVENIEQTNEEKQQEEKVKSEEQSKFVDALKSSSILKSLDLPADEPEELPNEAQEETQEDDTSSDVPESEENIPEDEDEELIPKSKIQPRVDKLKSEANYWKNKYNTDIESAKAKQPADEATSKLQGMSDSELKNLKREVRMAQIDAKEDRAKLSQLLDLEDKIDDTLRSAPQRFEEKQKGYYAQVANEISAGNEFTDKDVPEILKIAKDIYSSDSDLQKDVKGQGLALKAAVREYKAISRLSLKAKENPKLKSQIHSLKKATSLDTKTGKGTPQDNSLVSGLLRKAKAGGLTQTEKTALVVNDPRFGIDRFIPKDLEG